MAGKREQQMKEITERLEQGVKELFTSERYMEYLKTMSQFHNYSFNNTMLIAMQKPDATLVAGYQAWQKKFKRQVKRGEKGIQIIAPAPIREKEEVEKFDPVTNEPILRPDGKPETEEIEHIIPRFRLTTVFDISQTYGEPLPELETPELIGSVENFEIFMQAIREVSPVPIRFDEIESGAKGYYSNVNKEIVIQQGMSESQTMKTGVHETTHAKLHDRDIMEELGEKKNQMTREVEAESVAYTVCQYFGLDTSDYSFPYIAGWSSSMDMKELRSSMDTIRKTAGEMIDGMTEVMQRLMRERQEKEQAEEREKAAENTERYQEVELFDVPALFANGRVELETLPEGIYRYELRGTDSDPGYPYSVEEHVTVNHAATILTAFPLNLPEEGWLFIGDELNFTGGDMTIHEYQQTVTDRSIAVEQEKAENAIGRANEELYLSGKEDRYAVYQIISGTKGKDYRFMGLDFVVSHDMKVDAADYGYVYGGRLSGEETLDSLYEKFNVSHPEGYEGHSLSVSDVVVLQREGEAKAYYVDSFGFQELPDFVQERLHEAKMDRKRWFAPVTLDTDAVEIEQHEGLWHAVDKREIQDEIFYLMKHNEYGDSAAAVIVDSEGNLAAQELENGFDRGAMEAIKEYLSEKGIEWEPGEAELRELGIEEKTLPETVSEQKVYPPIYPYTLDFAVKHAAADEYLDSRKLNIECKNAVENAIRTHFDGLHLAHDAVDSVLEEYGRERLAYVLACTVQHKESDGRFSRGTKEWAASIPVAENVSRGMDLNNDYVIDSHPAVLDGFIGLARDKFAELEKMEQQKKAEPFIAQYYVVNDAYGIKAEREYQYFPDLDSALTAYMVLPNHLEKEIGMESTEQPPSRMSLIKCRNGLEVLEDIEAVSLSGKWINTESREAMRMAEMYLDNHDTEIAYHLEAAGRYFSIQTVSEGYDYTFYDNHFRELDGGIYDNPDISLQEAMKDILEDEGMSLSDCKVMDIEELQEKVNEAERERDEKLLTVESVTDLKGRRYEFNSGAREAVYEFDCLVNGKTAVLTYTVGQREHFHSPLYDRGEIEDVFSIHTDGEDVWDRMPEPELEKLERILAGEAEAFLIEERIAEASSIHDLKEVDYYMMDMESTSMTDVQKKRLWDGICGRGTIILEEALANAVSREEMQGVRDLLTAAESILGEEQYENLITAVQRKESELTESKDISLISDMTKPEKSLGGQGRAEIEETVLCYAQAQIDEMGLTDEVKLLGARVYGSRTRAGLYHDNSDVDVVLSYTGNIHEDSFFNVLHEDGMKIAGLPLDINPISLEKTGTLEEFMENAGKYLDMKEIQHLASDIVRYELDYEQDLDMLKFWDGDAEIETEPIYQVHEIIGKALEKKETDKFVEHLEQVIHEHGAEEPIVKAAADLLGKIAGKIVVVLPDAKVEITSGEDKEMQKLAEELDKFARDIDPYEYQDHVENSEDGYLYMMGYIANGETEGIKEQLALIAEENEIPENVAEAKRLLSRLEYIEKLQTGVELAKTEPDSEQVPKISFYVAECMEFPILGECHDNLTLEEAVRKYNEIPADRMNGVKGIGFRLEDGSMYDGDYELMSAGTISKDLIDLVPHYNESPLVQQAITDLEKLLSVGQREIVQRQPQEKQEDNAEKSVQEPPLSEGKDNKADTVQETAPEPLKQSEKTPEKDNPIAEGSGRKQSVLKALRERQAKLKEQEQKNTEQKTQGHKKGDQEL